MRHQIVASVVVLMLMVNVGSGDEDMGVLYTLSVDWNWCVSFGRAVSSIGDVNYDGVADVVIGLEYDFPYEVYVFSGLEGTLLDSVYSPDSGHRFGWSLDGVDDLDGDCLPDMIVGAMQEEADSCPSNWNSGKAYVFNVSTGALLHTLESPNCEEGGQFGWTVRGVEDVDGDGIEDLGVSTPWEDPGESPEEAGRAYVFSGASGQLLHELTSPNEEFQGFFGCSIAGLGDVDGDGRGDVAVGAYGEDGPDDLIDAGRVYVFSGSSGELMRILFSPQAEWSGYFGWAIEGLDDLDGDGVSEILIGAPYEDPGESPGFAGRAYVFSGSSGDLIHVLASPNEEWNGNFGSTVASARDIDGDEIEDLLVGAPYENPGASPQDAGRVYVFSGASGDLLYTLASPNEEEDGHFGYAISGFAAEERGGGPELIVGAPGEWEERGRAYVFGMVTGVDEMGLEPSRFSLRIVEMPIGGTPARFILDLPSEDEVRVSIFDIGGREVKSLNRGLLSAGNHAITWDGLVNSGKRAPSGMYICSVKGKEGEATARLVVIR